MLPSLTRRNKSILVHSTCLCQVTHLHLLFASFLLQRGILSPCFCSEPQCMFWENQPCFHVICSVRVPALHNSKHYQLEVQPAHTQQAQPSLTLGPFSAGVSGHPAGIWPMLWVLLHPEANKSEYLEHSANLIILVSKKCLIYWIRFCCTFFYCCQHTCLHAELRLWHLFPWNNTEPFTNTTPERQKSVPACPPHPGIIQTPPQQLTFTQETWYHHGMRLSCSNYLRDKELLLLSFMLLPVAICSTLVLSVPSAIPLSLQFTTSRV